MSSTTRTPSVATTRGAGISWAVIGVITSSPQSMLRFCWTAGAGLPRAVRLGRQHRRRHVRRIARLDPHVDHHSLTCLDCGNRLGIDLGQVGGVLYGPETARALCARETGEVRIRIADALS